jgi:predicted RNA-binding Zn-ribbon protein involved in translation (DUF1610 family)
MPDKEDKEAVMECPKCRGLVVREWVPESIEEEYQLRCLNCGWTAPMVPTKPPGPGLDSLVKGCCCGKHPGAAT